MTVLTKELHVTMPDHSVWAVPVSIIANSRADYYAKNYGGDIQRSLAEDTIPLFSADHYEIEDWAANNMNWADVKHAARCVSAGGADFDDGWANGKKTVEDAPE